VACAFLVERCRWLAPGTADSLLNEIDQLVALSRAFHGI
jgi:hypothetical protein